MTTIAPPKVPSRTYEQQLEALARANDIRTRRKHLKRDVKAGRKRVRALVLDPPEWALTMRVFELLLAAPKIGRVKANRIINACRIGPSKTLGGMTSRQREELIEVLQRRGYCG